MTGNNPTMWQRMYDDACERNYEKSYRIGVLQARIGFLRHALDAIGEYAAEHAEADRAWSAVLQIAREALRDHHAD
jgi:hypothetical protein